MQVMAGARHGGAEGFFERLVPALSEAGVDQSVVIRRDAERAQRLRARGIVPVELPFGGWFDIATKRALRRLAADFRPNVVLTWMNRASAKMPNGPYARCARLGGYYDLKYYGGCDHLIGNTRDIVDYLTREGWPPERAHYLPNFVDDTESAAAGRAALDTPGGAPLVVALGRLHVNKAFDVLIEAMTAAPGAYLWIAGAGPERTALEARAAVISDRVRFLGWRDDAPALIAAADVLVCPSRHEPLGNIVLEAWAQGKPVIAAAARGPAALIEDGVTGLLAPVDDPGALGQRIARLVSDPVLRRKLGSAGLAAMHRDFGRNAVIGKYLEFFEQIAGRR